MYRLSRLDLLPEILNFFEYMLSNEAVKLAFVASREFPPLDRFSIFSKEKKF